MQELVIFDFDKTLILDDSIVEFSLILIKAGYWKEDFWDKSGLSSVDRSCFSFLAKDKILNIWNSLECLEREKLLKKMRLKIEWNEDLVNHLRFCSSAYDILISSASFSFILLDLLRFKNIKYNHIHCGNKLEVFVNNSGVHKLLALNKLMLMHPYKVKYSFSDSIHDLPILLAADRGYVVCEGHGFKDDWSNNFSVENWRKLKH